MREPDFHGLHDDVGDIVQQPDFTTVRRRAGRLRIRQHLAVASAGLAVAAVVGAVGLTVLNPPAGSAPGHDPAGTPNASSSGDPLPAPYVRWAGAADAEHIYALVGDCADCPQRLMASEDGGRTWQKRYTFDKVTSSRGLVEPTVAGPETLIVGTLRPASSQPTAGPLPTATTTRGVGTLIDGQLGVPQWRISSDGGKTWRDLGSTDDAVPAVPADGAAVDCRYGQPPRGQCPLYAVLPSTGQFAPLANQPPLLRFDLANASISAGIWVHGYDPVTHRPAVAVSRDRGRTWTTSVFSAEAPAPVDDESTPAMYLPNVATTDGQTAYAMFAGDQGPLRIYRSTDGGRNWQRTNPDDKLPPGWTLASPETYVTMDGTHVLLAQRDGEPAFLGSRDGGPYAPLATPGLPNVRYQVPTVISAGRYLYYDENRLYLSDDGINWRATARP